MNLIGYVDIDINFEIILLRRGYNSIREIVEENSIELSVNLVGILERRKVFGGEGDGFRVGVWDYFKEGLGFD